MDKAMANLFFEQCCGDYNGHMADIPFNPPIQSLLMSCGVPPRRSDNLDERKQVFLKLLREFAFDIERGLVPQPIDPDEVPF